MYHTRRLSSFVLSLRRFIVVERPLLPKAVVDLLEKPSVSCRELLAVAKTLLSLSADDLAALHLCLAGARQKYYGPMTPREMCAVLDQANGAEIFP